MKKIIATLIILVLIGAGMYFYWQKNQTAPKPITNFEECVAAGNPIMESYPRQCKTKSGQNFVEDIGNADELKDSIILSAPKPNSIVRNPVLINGMARGNWFFEAQFPVKIIDANNNKVAKGVARATGDWMTTEFVSFVAVVNFGNPTTKTGTLILENDNPSGLAQNSKQLRIPIKFLPSN